MSESSAINIKAYWQKPGTEEQEIRRFNLEQDVATSFEYLQGKISTIFPELSRAVFSVYWIDMESDSILISSDEELMQALTLGMNDGNLLKLYIRAPGKTTGGNPTKPEGRKTECNIEHTGVVCDVCDQTIKGLRFKCLVCPDYDLCNACCEQGHHNYHYMLRMATPATDFPGCAGQAGSGQGAQGNAWWAPWQGAGPWAGNMRRWWRNTMRQQRQSMRSGGAGPCGPKGPGPCPPCPPGAPRAGAPGPSGMNPESSDEERREYLEHVGEQVSAFLEPLGIDIDVEVDNTAPGVRRRFGRGCGSRGQGNPGKSGRCGRNGKGGPCGDAGKCQPSADCSGKSAKGGRCANGGKCEPSADCSGKCAKGSRCANGGKCEPSADCSEKSAECQRAVQSGAAASQSTTDKPEEKKKVELIDLSENGPHTLTEQPPVCEMEDHELDDQYMEHDHSDDDESKSWIKIENKEHMETEQPEVKVTQPQISIISQPSPAGLSSLYPSLNGTTPSPIVYPGSMPSAPPNDQQAGTSQQATPPETQPPPKTQPPKTELDEKVEQAIEQMRNMGFHDEGGWMTALLYQYEGDVYKVIDSVLRIAANKQQ